MIFFVHMFDPYFLGAVNTSVLHDREEVYLTKNGKKIFKTQYQHCSSDTTAHGEVIGKENRRFFNNTVLKNASDSTDFDSDACQTLMYVTSFSWTHYL